MKKLSFLFCLVISLFNQSYVYSQDFWQQTNGPCGGSVWGMAVNLKGNIFAVTDGGISFSTNNGDRWIGINNGLTYPYPLCLASNNSGILFAGGEGVFRLNEIDSGWIPVNNGITYPYIISIAINSNGYIFAGSGGGGVFRSTDNGESWAHVLDNGYISALNITSGGYIFAANWDGILRSTDNGDSWIKTDNSLNSVVYSIASNSENFIFAGSPEGTFRSSNNGNEWNKINENGSSYLTITSNGDIITSDYEIVQYSTDNGDNWIQIQNKLYTWSITANSSGYIFIGTHADGVFRSSDNGANWTGINNGLSNTDIRALAITSGYLFAGTDEKGTFRSSNNGNFWNEIENTFPSNSVGSFAVNSSGEIFAGSHKLYRSADNGDTWSESSNGLNYFTYSLEIGPNGYMYASTFNEGVYRSTDNGNNWVQINNGLNRFVPVLAADSNGYIFAGTDRGIYRSTDNGDNWAYAGLTAEYVLSLVVNSKNDLFAGTGDPSQFFPVGNGKIFRSTNNGDSWTQVNNYEIDSSKAVHCLMINSNDDIFAGTREGGLFMSTDNGETWIQKNSGLNTLYILSLAVDSMGYLYAGTLGGGVSRSSKSTTSDSSFVTLFPGACQVWEANTFREIKWLSSNVKNIKIDYSTNNGSDWTAITSNFSASCSIFNWLVKNTPSQNCRIKISDNENPNVFDISDGLFTIAGSSGYPPDIIPKDFSLSQNYPNPFNPITTILYSIPRQSFVILKVYDVLGNEVTTLVNQEKAAGNYMVQLEAGSLSSGIYFYKMEAGEFTSVKKLVLLK